LHEPPPLFPGSSAVEQPAVNRLVAGSNPARGAKQIKSLTKIDPSSSTLKEDRGYAGATVVADAFSG
jgi:hypothetical protein